MKIFISHSSGDKWVAQKIGEEIHSLGVETFLDAQNIVTGDDFDEEIRRQLAESDEILFIISAAALRSQWVMMELGAARAMRKRLVLILVGVSPNELPSPINRHLARDINEIHSYYGEVRTRLESKGSDGASAASIPDEPLIAPPPPPRAKIDPLHVGDHVRVSERPVDPEEFPVMVPEMEQYLGLVATITNVEESRAKVFRLDLDNGTYMWAERWLKRAE